jgi:hypothetical protein
MFIFRAGYMLIVCSGHIYIVCAGRMFIVRVQNVSYVFKTFFYVFKTFTSQKF